MNYLYHWVPKNMQGEVLYPLNKLKEIYPDVYKEHVLKYEGREKVMDQRIPSLNCLWNDVLHFSAVHPSLIKQALVQAGRTEPFDIEYFEIDPHLLDPNNTIVYLYKHQNILNKFDDDNFTIYDPDNIAQYSEVPQLTKDYYTEMIREGKKPLHYHMVPHILYKGPLNVNGAKHITV